MVNIYTDTDKLKIICEFTNHKNFPYGTTVLTFDINGLSMDSTNDLILFNNSIGGFVFASFIDDLYFNNTKATMATVNQLFQSTCFNCCSGTGGDIHFDSKEIVDALNAINKTLKTSGGTYYDEDYMTIEEYEAITPEEDKKYLIYIEDEENS